MRSFCGKEMVEYSPYRPTKRQAYRMSFKSNAPKYHPYYLSSFIPRAHQCATGSSESWACDFCEVATFRTYEEAYVHEQTCSMNRRGHLISQDYTNKALSTQSVNKQNMSLATQEDTSSLSDRQCYVRSHFVETFAANEGDVAGRHSKGAQKLYVGQIGIRCKHCANIPPKSKAERAVCYPSSISRIYQTVADMQRFHFEVCTAIPLEMKNTYKNMKTTRPRGMGSPQSYWISSAKKLGLVDTAQGISFGLGSIGSRNTSFQKPPLKKVHRILSSRDSPPILSSPHPPSPHPPSSPESHGTSHSLLPSERGENSDCEMPSGDSEANMLLALRHSQTHNVIEKGTDASNL